MYAASSRQVAQAHHLLLSGLTVLGIFLSEGATLAKYIFLFQIIHRTSEVILMIRTYALWERKRSVLVSFSILSAVRLHSLVSVPGLIEIQSTLISIAVLLQFELASLKCLSLTFPSTQPTLTLLRRTYRRSGLPPRQRQLNHNFRIYDLGDLRDQWALLSPLSHVLIFIQRLW
jgi:hypothetical protein